MLNKVVSLLTKCKSITMFLDARSPLLVAVHQDQSKVCDDAVDQSDQEQNAMVETSQQTFNIRDKAVAYPMSSPN